MRVMGIGLLWVGLISAEVVWGQQMGGRQSEIRYIDFGSGNDSNLGTSRERPWQRHPSDPQASGNSKAAAGRDFTYVLKRGVPYRGILRPGDGDSVRLTTDPGWGQGEAMVYGSEVVGRWRRGATDVTTKPDSLSRKIPEEDKVWVSEVNFLPRTLWAVARDGTIIRLKLARTPNWSEPDPNDVMSEWWAWENPEWWKGEGHTLMVNGKARHAGIDRGRLRGSAEEYVGATVWSEWGIVMGSPYPSKVEAFDARLRAVAFRGPWTWEKSEKIIKGNRYYLEDKPQFLDEPGEFWVERVGDGNGEGKGRIYMRLPGDVSPELVTLEAGRYCTLIDMKRVEDVEIRGLTFRFTNVQWDYNSPSWAHPDLKAAAIRLNGGARSVTIRDNLFEQVNMAARLNVGSTGDRIERVDCSENVIRDTDHGGVLVASKFEGGKVGRVGHVDFKKNQLERIGWRILSGEHGHAVNLEFPETSEVASNQLRRVAGWGIAVFGGKPSGKNGEGIEVPLSRHLIHDNRVEDALCKSNDWGAIETWQGGPFYVFNNVVINPLGYKNWTLRPGDPTSIGSFGHAYYLDGSFKNYLFNNIAEGRNNKLGTKSVNSTAVQSIFSFDNTFFHNTFHRFAAMTRQQAPEAGRFRYLGNVMEDVSSMLFRHADPKEGTPDPNAAHYKQGGKFAYDTLAYASNVMFDIRGDWGVFEETGYVYKAMPQMVEALRRLRAYGSEVGIVAGRSSLRDPSKGDFSPAEGAESIGRGVKVFVPWGLSRVVGEWHFLRNEAEARKVLDEHWYMTGEYVNREEYKSIVRNDLELVGGGEASYTQGTLEDWIAGSAVELDGRGMYLKSTSGDAGGGVGSSLDMKDGNWLIEMVFRTKDEAGVLVSKMTDEAGYMLELVGGVPKVTIRGGGNEYRTEGEVRIAGGQWRHLVVEVSRGAERAGVNGVGVGVGVRMYVDGEEIWSKSEGKMPLGVVGNRAEFCVGGGPGLDHLEASVDFLRVARGTLLEASTTIAELYRWQFDGPQFRDIEGRDRRSAGNAAGAVIPGKK